MAESNMQIYTKSKSIDSRHWNPKEFFNAPSQQKNEVAPMAKPRDPSPQNTNPGNQQAKKAKKKKNEIDSTQNV